MTELVKGLVIRTTDYKDADKMVTILTERGQISALAKGIRRKSSKISAAAGLFTYCTFQLFQSGTTYTLDDADIEIQFHNLSQDIEKLSLASYFAQLSGQEQEGAGHSAELLRLMLNCLYAIEKESAPRVLIKAAFELRTCQCWGYCPTLTMGACCKTADKLYISLDEGRITCKTCGAVGIPVNKDALAAVNYILSAELKKILSFKLEGEAVGCLEDFAQQYILDKLEYAPKTLAFYKTIIGTVL